MEPSPIPITWRVREGVAGMEDGAADDSADTSSGLDDLEEPLLGGHQAALPTSNFWACTANLCKSVLGAGMMALPQACALLGAYLGLGMLGAVGVLTAYSICQGLVRPTTRLLAHSSFSHDHNTMSYSSLVRVYLGLAPVQLLNAFVLANAIGYSVMYVDVIADVLLGDAQNPGILATVFPTWLLSRPAFLLALMTFVIAPLSLQRNIASLKSLNALGLLALAALGLSVAWLAGAALIQGKAHSLPLWPDVGSATSLGGKLMVALSPLPVVLASDGCHMNVLPMSKSMKPFNRGSLEAVVWVSMLACSAFYALFSAASIVAFGPGIQEDLLRNLNPADMAPLIGNTQALFIAYTVRIAFSLSLLGSFALNLFPLRDALFDVACGSGEVKAAAQHKYHDFVTIAVLILVYGLAVGIPSIWVVIGFVGSIASTGVCYLFPALLMFAHGAIKGLTCTHGAGAALVFAIGAFILVNGLLNPL